MLSSKKQQFIFLMTSTKPHYYGHRERLRERFKKVGYIGFHDYELLELFLCLCIPRGDVKPIAKDLLTRFKTLEHVLHADDNLLKEIKGVGDSTVMGLKVMLSMHQRLNQMNLQHRNILNSFSEVLRYCYTHMAFERTEEVRILYLDHRMGLILDDVHQKGTIDRVGIYVNEIIKKALDVGAKGMLMVHNHPSGSPEPSAYDEIITESLENALKSLNLILHDHIIIGREGFYSFNKKKIL